MYLDGSYIVLRAKYSSNLEATYARIDMNASSSGPFSQFSPANTTVQVSTNNGLKINAYSTANYEFAYNISYASLIVGWIAFAFAFLFCWYEWKQLGTELYFTIQFSWMSLVIMQYFTPTMVSLGTANNIMGYNNIA